MCGFQKFGETENRHASLSYEMRETLSSFYEASIHCGIQHPAQDSGQLQIQQLAAAGWMVKCWDYHQVPETN